MSGTTVFSTKIACVVIAASFTASSAAASVFLDQGPNDTPEHAQLIGDGRVFDLQSLDDFLAFSLLSIEGTITPGDVDYYQVSFTGGELSFIDVWPVGDASVQLFAFDADTGLVIDFVTDGPWLTTSQPRTTGVRTVVFGISGGGDLTPDPQSDPDSIFPDPSPLMGQPTTDTGLLDGLHAETGQPHQESFSYTLGFVPNFIPSPASLAMAGVASLALSRRRRAISAVA